MSKNKKQNKVKIKKSEIEKSPSSNSSFGSSILENYSKWRQDFIEDIQIEEIVEEKSKTEINFTDSLINSDIGEDTFADNVGKEVMKSKDDNSGEDIIITETQRLKLISDNVTPLYERRKLGKKFEKKEFENLKTENKDNDSELEEKETPFTKNRDFKKVLIEESKENEMIAYKSSKALKITFLCSVILCFLVVGFFGIKAYYSLSIKFPEIINEIESKKASSYSSRIIFNEKTPNDDELKGFIENLNGNGDNLDLVKKWLKEDADNIKKDSSYVSKRPIRLEKYGKVYGVFDDYKIVLDPVKLKLEKSDKVDTFIVINGQEQPIGVDEYSLFPGNYVVYYNDNGVKLKNIVNLFPTENNELITITYGSDADYEIANESVKLDVNAKDSDFTITTRDNQSIVFVNDKNTGLTVKDFNSLKGTNIKVGDDIKVVTKMPWGYNISKGVKYNGEKSLTVSNSLSEPKLLDVAISKSLKLFKEDVYARGSKDETVLTVMVDEALYYAKNRIQGLVNSKRSYIGGFVSMEFDLDSFEIRPYKDTYEMYIGGHLLVQDTTYEDGKKAPEITSIKAENEKIGIHFIFDNEKNDWFCNVWGFTTRYISRDNIKSIDISKDMIVR